MVAGPGGYVRGRGRRGTTGGRVGVPLGSTVDRNLVPFRTPLKPTYLSQLPSRVKFLAN